MKILAILLLLLASPALQAEQLTLANRDWLTSVEKRTLLKFISECALRKDQVLASRDDGVLFEYYGSLGLAPRWDGHPSSLTISEQRWISACVLARANYFGTPVPINLRTPTGSPLQLPVSPQEKENFPYFEGAFFGNIFDGDPKKYACMGDAPQKILVEKNRICALPALNNQPGKRNACGYYVTGSCSDPLSFARDGNHYTEVIQIWLK